MIASSKKLVLIDMQKVSFLGSMDLRTLVSVARAVGGKIAMLGPGEEVEKVLTMSGVDTMVPIHHDFSGGVASLQ